MKRSELIKILKKYNCRLIREGTEHEMWYSEINGNNFPIWRHANKDIPTGTLNKILKEAGIK